MTECLLLGLSEEYFWESTPRKIIALIDQKKQIEKAKTKNLAIYITSMVWGKDPDELEKTDGNGFTAIPVNVYDNWWFYVVGTNNGYVMPRSGDVTVEYYYYDI